MTWAMIFPGQGSQSVGMLDSLDAAFPVVHRTFETASQTLGWDLWQLVHAGPEERLNETANTQPALLAADVACYQAWRAAGGAEPQFMAGHSLGEYAALVCAGSLSFVDGLKLVRARGELMQAAVAAGVGAMAAILGLEDAVVVQVCADAAQGEIVEAVNYNSPGQLVIAGHATAVARAGALARAAGAKRVLPLAVSVPSHSSLMREASERLRAVLADVTVRVPHIPVLHNVHLQSETSASGIRDALVRQLYTPVQWTGTIRALVAAGVTRVV
ncbi:MAG TPA: ACP S-malonyltransferase, partial [Acidiferrobacteraceae bacterium]|nr:ACP S-malonyltransferase [Acidiferrobacteraceae bacterium]